MVASDKLPSSKDRSDESNLSRDEAAARAARDRLFTAVVDDLSSGSSSSSSSTDKTSTSEITSSGKDSKTSTTSSSSDSTTAAKSLDGAPTSTGKSGDAGSSPAGKSGDAPARTTEARAAEAVATLVSRAGDTAATVAPKAVDAPITSSAIDTPTTAGQPRPNDVLTATATNAIDALQAPATRVADAKDSVASLLGIPTAAPRFSELALAGTTSLGELSATKTGLSDLLNSRFTDATGQKALAIDVLQPRSENLPLAERIKVENEFLQTRHGEVPGSATARLNDLLEVKPGELPGLRVLDASKAPAREDVPETDAEVIARVRESLSLGGAAGDRVLPGKDGTQLRVNLDGQLTMISDGKSSVEVEYENGKDGRIKTIIENHNGQTTVWQAGKDFNPGDATIGKDGSVIINSADGKHSRTITTDLSVVLKDRGTIGDGSDDRVTQVLSRDGGLRTFEYDKTSGKLISIEDRVHTNSGKDLIEKTVRIGDSNNWSWENNYGKPAELRTNLLVDGRGDFKADKHAISRPSDIVKTDNSDAMHADLATARQKFKEIAGSKGLFGSNATVEKWERKFEQRCRDRAHSGKTAPTDQQIMKTYENLANILQGSGTISSSRRRYLVEAAMRSYGEPNRYVNQGSHPSCCLASVERHVVETKPDDHSRVIMEAVNKGYIVSKGEGKNGSKTRLRLSETQLAMDGESASQAKGKGWGAAWSYSNKIFQIACIKLGQGGRYQGNGHGFNGATIDQARTANKFITGEKSLYLVDRWMGGKPSFDKLQNVLKKGTAHYFVPGHSMVIDDAKVIKGQQYVHIDNWWGGQGDGWRRYDRI